MQTRPALFAQTKAARAADAAKLLPLTLHVESHRARDSAAPGAESQSVEYALAHWCERMANTAGQNGCTFQSSPGFYGTYPWIDHETGVYGVILQKDRLQRVGEATRKLRNSLIELYA